MAGTPPAADSSGGQARRTLEKMIAGLSASKRDLLAEMLRPQREPVAVIGMACRFPGADSPEAYWQLLSQGVDAVREVPPDRWDADAFYAPGEPVRGKTNSRWAGLIDDIDAFDAGFFGISPREAARMDPQQRLLLEVTWNALEDAGLTTQALSASRAGVFIGIGPSEYSWMQPRDPHLIDIHSGTGISANVAAGRISYLFDLTGPSLAIDTGCSSALTALHYACRSLREHESDLVIVGAVNAVLLPLMTVLSTQMGGTAPDGRCKAFDARANGYVRGEGAGVVVLRRLADATASGDPVHALIHGSAVNQDGKTAGLTAPSRHAQEAVLAAALRDAGLTPDAIAYLEAHGTGTPLGDPIEFQAIQSVLDRARDHSLPCYVGSAKTNLGHLEAAAGMAGLLKAILAIRNGAIPPNLHFDTLNPNVSAEGSRLRIPTALVPWPEAAQGRYAGVSAFGWSGANAHVVLGEPPAGPAMPDAEPGAHVLPVSARSPRALRELCLRWADLLNAPGAADDVADHAWTAGNRRTHGQYRVAFVDRTATALADQARRHAAGAPDARPTGSRRPKMAFVFSGHGSQWAQMGIDLYEDEPVFRGVIDECDRALGKRTGWSLCEELAAPEGRTRLDGTNRADIIQPAIFAVQVGLAALLRHWGLRPDAVLGHSLGEVAAAHVAGALTLDEAAEVVTVRSRLAEDVSPGLGMAVIDLPLAPVADMAAQYGAMLGVAAVNSPSSTTIGGNRQAIDKLLAECERLRVTARPIRVEGATHCPAVEPVLPMLREALVGLRPSPPSTPFLSSVEGMTRERPALDADYWARNLRRTVRFDEALSVAAGEGITLFVEISPRPILLRAIRDSAERLPAAVTGLPSLTRGTYGPSVVRRTVADLWERGGHVDWAALQGHRRRVTRAPAYPWQRSRFWIEAEGIREPRTPGATALASPASGPPGEPDRVPGPRLCATEWRPAGQDGSPAVDWLVVSGAGTAGHRLLTAAESQGLRTCTPDHVAAAVSRAAGQGGGREPRILYVCAPALDGVDLDDPCAPRAMAAAAGELVTVVNAIISRPGEGPIPVCVATSGAFDAGGDPGANVAAAHLVGLARTLRLEHPDLQFDIVDLPAADGDLDLRAALASGHGEREIAIRGGSALARRIVPVGDPSRQRPFEADSAGTYLITGGTGGVGLAVARWLADCGARSLVLASRSATCPPSADATVASLREAGVQVAVRPVDVSDRQAVHALIQEIHNPGAPLRGVFHAAGVLDDAMATELTAARFAGILAAKVSGTWNLHLATRDLGLEHFVLFSSLASVLGSPSQANYAAANAAMDAIARLRRQLRLPAVSVSWGPWAEVGGAAPKQTWTGFLHRFGLRATAPADLLVLLAQSMESGLAHVAAIDGDGAALAASLEWPNPRLLSELTPPGERPSPGEPGSSGPWAAALAAGEGEQRRALLVDCLLAEVSAALRVGVADLDADAAWSSMGLDSVTALEVSARARQETGVQLTPRTVIECPSISSLAEFLDQRIAKSTAADGTADD